MKMMSEEEIKKIVDNISVPRIETYESLGFVGRDENLLAAYFSIQEISSHFFVPLQVLEICLRNSIHNALDNLFSDHCNSIKWYNLVHLSNESKKTLRQAKSNTIKKCGGNYSDDDLVSNLMFGFWVYMLDTQHRDYSNEYHFWQYKLDEIFPGRNGKKVKEIFDELKRINRNRNRLYHHEPIWKGKKQKTYHEAISVLEVEYRKIYEALGWIAQEKKGYMERLGFFQRFMDCCEKHRHA
ncbi:MAG: hypothetical protein ABGX74_05210 [Psychrobacter sp.]